VENGGLGEEKSKADATFLMTLQSPHSSPPLERLIKGNQMNLPDQIDEYSSLTHSLFSHTIRIDCGSI
jgi:hypothetical protein